MDRPVLHRSDSAMHEPAPLDPRLRYHPLVRRIATGLRRRCGIGEGDAVLVAVSGGADSVALLRAMHLLADRRKWRLRLVVGHVHHGLRGEAADGDADFVAALADSLSLVSQQAHIHPSHQPGNLESNSRRLRYGALARMAGDHHCTALATAHHADDQLETLLMHLLRGSAPRGMRGIAWQRPHRQTQIIRPMLATTHAEALEFLRHLRQPHREDATNLDPARTRARLRSDVLPILRDLNPRAALNALRTADHMRDAAAQLNETATDR